MRLLVEICLAGMLTVVAGFAGVLLDDWLSHRRQRQREHGRGVGWAHRCPYRVERSE